MEHAIHNLTLDLTAPDECPVVEVSRGDSARTLVISLTQGGRPYRIAEGITAAFSATKPDGNPLLNACTVENNRIVYRFTPQTANVAGVFDGEIWLVSGDKRELTTPRFTIAVDERIRTDDVIPDSEPEYTAITEMVAAGTAMLEEIREALAGLENAEEILTQARTEAQKAAEAATAAQTVESRVNSAVQQANKYAYEANLSAVAAAGSAGDARAQAEAAGNSAQSAQEAAQEAGVLENSTSRYANDAYNFAVEAKKAAEEAAAAGGATTGEDAPSSATEGRVGSLYLQTGITPNCLWVCIGADDGVYRWQQCNAYAELDLSDGSDGGVLLVPEGTETQPVLNLYGRHGDENVTLRGVAPAQRDTDAPNLQQVQGLIDAITASKVSVSDIVDNLSTNVTGRPLSAAQGVVLKALIDELSTGKLDTSALPEAIKTALAQAKAGGEFDGEDGEDGITPHIGENGNWFTGSTDTGVTATGPQGEAGVSGVYTLGEGESLEDAPEDADVVIDPGGAPTMETWVFTLADGTTVEKQVYVYAV